VSPLDPELRAGLVDLIGLELVQRTEREFDELCRDHGFEPDDVGGYLGLVYFRTRARFGVRGWQVDPPAVLH
jgi:hypothetical protein